MVACFKPTQPNVYCPTKQQHLHQCFDYTVRTVAFREALFLVVGDGRIVYTPAFVQK